MRVHSICGGLLILALLGPAVTSCDETTCGEGTVLRGGECVPLQPINCTGPGVRFENGRCVPDFSEVCGPGTELSEDGTYCVSTEPPADPAADAGQDTQPPDVPADAPDAEPDLVAEPDVPTDAEEEEVVVWVPECGEDLVAGEQVCAWGQALNFINLAPLPGDTADPGLEVQIKDLFHALSNPTEVLGSGPIEANGMFIVPSFDLIETPPRTLILIVGEEDAALNNPGTAWQGCISGIVQTDTITTEYDELPVFGLPRASVTAWNTALSPTNLDPTGFVLIRIVDFIGPGQYVPLEGATLVYQGAGTVTIRYFDDLALTTLKPDTATTTGPSGVALLIPGAGAAATDTCTASATDYAPTASVACGANPYRASINYIFMLATD